MDSTSVVMLHPDTSAYLGSVTHPKLIRTKTPWNFLDWSSRQRLWQLAQRTTQRTLKRLNVGISTTPGYSRGALHDRAHVAPRIGGNDHRHRDPSAAVALLLDAHDRAVEIKT